MARPGELLRRARESRRGALAMGAMPGWRAESAARQPEFTARRPESEMGKPVSTTWRPESETGQPVSATWRPESEMRQPTPATWRPEAEARQPEAAAGRARPEPQAHHGAYSALMRSHDRMRTCHLPVQGGGGRA